MVVAPERAMISIASIILEGMSLIRGKKLLMSLGLGIPSLPGQSAIGLERYNGPSRPEFASRQREFHDGETEWSLGIATSTAWRGRRVEMHLITSAI